MFRKNVSRQFSLSMLILFVTGIGCYLGGRIQGYRLGVAIWDTASNYTEVYSIGVLKDPEVSPKADLEAFTLRMKNDVMPGVWMESGGKASARPMGKTSTLAVSGNQLVLEAVARYVSKAKELARIKQQATSLPGDSHIEQRDH